MSTVNTAISALVAGFATVVASSTRVIDGPPWGTQPDDFLCVGHTGNLGEAAVTVATPSARFSGSLAESFSVECYLTLFLDESATVPAVRARAIAEYEACAAWLFANQSLGAVVDHAQISGFTVSVAQDDESGIALGLNFAVAVNGMA